MTTGDRGDLWHMRDGFENVLQGLGPTPAEAAIAFDRAWYTGKDEVFPVPKEPPEEPL